jgi:hypothetical protein
MKQFIQRIISVGILVVYYIVIDILELVSIKISGILGSVASLLATTLYQGNHIGTTSSGISYQLRDIYSICRCCWNVATYEWKVHNGKIQGFLKKNEKLLARSFNFTFRYIDDVLSLNNSRLGDFVDRIYLIELEIKDTTDIDRSASYLVKEHHLYSGT